VITASANTTTTSANTVGADGKVFVFWDGHEWRAPASAYDHVGGQAGARGDLINHAQAPQRNRPVIVQGTARKFIHGEKLSLKNLYVGDVIGFVSETGDKHVGIAVGAAFGWLKVMADNLVFFVDTTKIEYLNGTYVYR
jgi:uncharacterized phosphosugar-binding protein